MWRARGVAMGISQGRVGGDDKGVNIGWPDRKGEIQLKMWLRSGRMGPKGDKGRFGVWPKWGWTLKWGQYEREVKCGGVLWDGGGSGVSRVTRGAEVQGDFRFPAGGACWRRAELRAGCGSGCAHLPVFSSALQPLAWAMGCPVLLLLLLAFLMPGIAIPVPPSLRALSNLHLSTSLTSHPVVVGKYSIHYFEQQVRQGGSWEEEIGVS